VLTMRFLLIHEALVNPFISFKEKMIQMWLLMDTFDRIYVIGSFFHYTNMFDPAKCIDLSIDEHDRLVMVTATKKQNNESS